MGDGAKDEFKVLFANYVPPWRASPMARAKNNAAKYKQWHLEFLRPNAPLDGAQQTVGRAEQSDNEDYMSGAGTLLNRTATKLGSH